MPKSVCFERPIHPVKADFHLVEFSDWIGNPLLMFENVCLEFE